MGSLDVGWSDLGSWTALLAALASGERAARAVGSSSAARRSTSGPTTWWSGGSDGRLVVDAGPRGGRIRRDGRRRRRLGPSHRGAHLAAEVHALLDRVARQEDRA